MATSLSLSVHMHFDTGAIRKELEGYPDSFWTKVVMRQSDAKMDVSLTGIRGRHVHQKVLCRSYPKGRFAKLFKMAGSKWLHKKGVYQALLELGTSCCAWQLHKPH